LAQELLKRLERLFFAFHVDIYARGSVAHPAEQVKLVCQAEDEGAESYALDDACDVYLACWHADL
jgi:hypothetical protein